MEKFTVKAVDSADQKSEAEIEKELLDKAVGTPTDEELAAQEAERVKAEELAAAEDTAKAEIKDEDVLSYFKSKHGKELTSIEQLFETKEKDELPEEVAKYLKYKEETGRGMTDFFRVNENVEDLSDAQVLARYYSETAEGLTPEEISDHINDSFSFDEDLDDEVDVRRKKRAKKQEISKAKKFLTEQNQKYSAPLESSGRNSEESAEEIKAYREYISNAKTAKEQAARKNEWFEKKTDEVFSNDFKGFDFKVNDKSITFQPSNATESKEAQKNIGNFISAFLDENGMMKDAAGYHKALSMAMNPDAYAKFFYEQGVADNVSETATGFKNTTLGGHKLSEKGGGDAPKVRAVNSDSGSGLKIKNRTKN